MNHLTDFQLNEYLDNALDETMKRGFDSHLQTCEDCSARLDELKTLFANIESLPEVKLRRDLSPAILARLSQQPRIWTPFFAAQLGTALGVFFWLSMQAANFIRPFDIQFNVSDLQFSNLNSMLPVFQSLFTVSKFQLPAFNLSTFQPSTFNFPTLNLSTSNLAFISVSIFMLWLVGNLTLLRNRSGVQK